MLNMADKYNMLGVIMLNVAFTNCYAECHYAECLYPKGHGALQIVGLTLDSRKNIFFVKKQLFSHNKLERFLSLASIHSYSF
jgi:hypothetical protein